MNTIHIYLAGTGTIEINNVDDVSTDYGVLKVLYNVGEPTGPKVVGYAPGQWLWFEVYAGEEL